MARGYHGICAIKSDHMRLVCSTGLRFIAAMKNTFTRRVFLGGLASGVATAVWAEAPAVSLRPQLRGAGFHKRTAPAAKALLDASGVRGEVGFLVADADSGLRLEGHNAATGIPPASVAKAITALYALDVLGPEHRFQTRLMTAGKIENGILQGDLVLAGGADPTLDTNALAEMAQGLKDSGVREVRGDFLVYDGALPFVSSIDPDQPDHVGYSPAVSGIALNFNRVHFEWRRGSNGYGVTMDARSDKYRPDVTVARMQVADRSTPIYTYATTGVQDQWTVAKGALGKSGARWLPVRKPALYAGDVFRTLARAHGVQLKAAVTVQDAPAGRVLVTHSSEPLTDILRDMLKYSTNLTAEMVGMATSAVRAGQITSLRASAREMNLWAQSSMGLTDIDLVDHSGLGGASSISAADMVQALAHPKSRQGLRPLLKTIGMRDSKGRIDKNHPIKVSAKTGTLNFVSGLAGYMTAQDGTELVFAIFAADEQTRNKIKRADRERPEGARPWNRRAKTLQQNLIERWGLVYGS
ncbi:hypothetical protein SuNHUV7_04500 (plasmid) [Pseudoseohaeicola sp. NH-UV-7]